MKKLLSLIIISLLSYPLLVSAAGFMSSASGNKKPTNSTNYIEKTDDRIVISLSGSTTVSNIINLLAGQFEQKHTDTVLKLTGGGSSSALKAMLTDPNIVGQMSRPMKEKERISYKAQYGVDPIELKIAVDAIAIFVHKDNPIQQVTMAQLKSVFVQNKHDEEIELWQSLGINPSEDDYWQTAKIQRYGLSSTTGAYSLFKKKVLNKQEFNVQIESFSTSSSTVQAVGVEKSGIAFSSSFYATKKTKFLAIQADDKQYYQPNEQSLTNLDYPLARYLYLYITPGSETATSTAFKQFVHFLMAQDTQALIKRAGFYSVSKTIRNKQSVLFD